MIKQVQSNEADEDVRSDAFRFLLAGVFNTAVTFITYQALLYFMPPTIAYTTTWTVGIGLVALLYPTHVFRGGDESWRSRTLVVLVYVIGFLLGLTIIELLSSQFDIRRSAIIPALCVTTLFNFFAMRLVTRHNVL